MTNDKIEEMLRKHTEALQDAIGHLQRHDEDILNTKKAIVALTEATTSLTGAAASIVVALAEGQRAQYGPTTPPMFSSRLSQVQTAVNAAIAKVRSVVILLGGNVE